MQEYLPTVCASVNVSVFVVCAFICVCVSVNVSIVCALYASVCLLCA